MGAAPHARTRFRPGGRPPAEEYRHPAVPGSALGIGAWPRASRSSRRSSPRARDGAAEVRHHRHRRRHRRLLRGRRRDLPTRQQGPRQDRHPLLGRVDRRLGLQRQHHQGRRARLRHGAVRRAVPGLQRRRAVQGSRTRICARCSRCIPSRSRWWRARKPTSAKFDRLQGQALQRRQSGLGHALGDGRAARRDGHEDVGLLARLRAQGRRARPGAVRQQDRRLLLRRRPSVGQHPGSDHDLRRQARAAHRPRGRRAGREASVLREGHDPGRHVRQQPEADARPTACWRRW